MLYVFHVNTGNMMTLNMSLTTESVQKLKEYIDRVYNIPAEKQVFLISGGECLDPTKRVCSYSSGTDTNPIFLCTKLNEGSPKPQATVLDFREEQELLEKERKYAELPPSFQAVNKRAQLAQEFSDNAVHLLRLCEKLVSDQHNQHQGWAAVVANFEDVMTEFKNQFSQLECDFNEYIQEKEYYKQFLHKFKDDIQILRRIPVLPKLLETNNQGKYLMDTSKNDTEEVKENHVTLFDWIGKDEHGHDLEMMYEKCIIELDYYEREEFNRLSSEVSAVLDSAENVDMKEIRGMGQRLYSLDLIIQEAKVKVQDQNESATAVIKNQSRLQKMKDSSILPDLCTCHIKQLCSMAKIHRELIDTCQRCNRAKGELNDTLVARLGWVMHTQNHMQKIGDQIDVFSENIAKLRYQMGILEQVDMAPVAYLSYIAEIVRRRSFSQEFLVWASEVACRLLTIHNEEVARRKDFQSKFEEHFIQALFPGMEDLPPGYGIQAPSYFDTGLPKLNRDDVEFIRNELPDMADYLNINDSDSPYSHLLKSVLNTEEEEKISEENLLQEVVDQIEVPNNMDRVTSTPNDGGRESSLISVHGLAHLKDLDRGCESETDTEEFEKVGQIPLELNFDKDIPSSPRPLTQDASTLTEVGEQRSNVPPKKPPRIFQKVPTIQTSSVDETTFQRTLSISGSQSNTESFTNIKNPSLESIDELSSLKNFSSNTESCFNSHYQQQIQSGHLLRSKSLSPHTPVSPKEQQPLESPKSPITGHQNADFINDEFYIDESLPSSLSIENGQSQGEFGKQLDTANTVVALLQGNLEVSRCEHDKLKFLLTRIGNIVFQTIREIKSEMADIKRQYTSDKNALVQTLQNLNTSCTSLGSEQELREEAIIQRMSSEHSNEINDFRKLAQVKNEEIKKLRTMVLFLENKMKTISEEILKTKDDFNAERVELEKRIFLLETEKEKCVKEITEKLNREHKNEIKTLQQRFKLVTMERTPSESSLEKTLEFSSLTNHELIVSQMKENFELDKVKAVNEIIENETQKWHGVIEQLKADFELEKNYLLNTLTTEITDEKDKQIDELKQREKVLMDRIQRFEIDSDDNKKQIDSLENKNVDLRLELQKLVSETTDMVSSVGTFSEGKTDSATSPIKRPKSLTKSMSVSSGKVNKLNVDSMKHGDCVVIVWDEEHDSFKVVQDSPVIYFLHPDSISALNLEIADGPPKKPNKLYCLGEYIDREYCHARKSGNRYKVPQGTRFFRVKVRPLERDKTSPKIDISMTQSQTLTESTVAEPEFHSLPSSPRTSRLSTEPEMTSEVYVSTGYDFSTGS